MSVVNKMLNDLEKRKSTDKPSADYVPSTKADNNNRVVLILVALLVMLGATLIWLNTSQSNKKGGTAQVKTAVVTEQTQLGAGNDGSDMQVNLTGKIDSTQITELSDASSQGATAGDVEIIFSSETPSEFSERLRPPSLSANLNASTSSDDTAVNAGQPPQTHSDLSAVDRTKDVSQKNSNEPESPLSVPVNKGATDVRVANKSSRPNEPSEMSKMSVKSSRDSVNPQTLEQNAQVALNNRDKASAIRHLQELMSVQPRNANARKRLASLLFAQGQTSAASETLSRGIALHPEDSSMRMMQARLLFRNSEHSTALSLLKEQPKTVTLEDDFLSFRAALAENQKDFEQSVSDYQMLIKRQPNNARWWLGLGVSLDKQGNAKQASDAYQRVRSLNQLSDQVLAFVEERLAAIEG